MKLGKKVKQSEFLDAMGGELSIAAASEAPQERITSYSTGKGDIEQAQSPTKKGSVYLPFV